MGGGVFGAWVDGEWMGRGWGVDEEWMGGGWRVDGGGGSGSPSTPLIDPPFLSNINKVQL